MTFHPVKAADGSWRYPPEEIAAVLRGLVADDATVEPNGAICAGAFQQFRDGKTLVDVVIGLKLEPPAVRRLRAEFDSMTGSLTLESAMLQAVGKLLGTVPKDGTNVVALVTALVEKAGSEYRRGYADGLSEASDLGEIVDPDTGKKRPLAPHEVTAATRTVEERWREGSSAKAPVDEVRLEPATAEDNRWKARVTSSTSDDRTVMRSNPLPPSRLEPGTE
jgi:hypothetical protein